MATENLPLIATIILLFPVLYFGFVSPTFFLRSLEDPTVTWLLRGLFNLWLLAVAGCGGLAALAFAAAGRMPVVIAMAGLAIAALAARQWFLRRMDALLQARDAGDVGATRRLRRLHVAGMLYNVVQAVALIAAIPTFLVPTA